MKRYIFAALALTSMFACQEQDIETYSGGRYLAFSTLDTAEKTTFVDSTFVSFSYHPDATEIEFKPEINLIGKISDADLTYHVEVIDSLTTAPKANYSFPTTQTFKGGMLKDSLRMKLLKTSELKDAICVVFAITPGGDFLGGMPGKHILKIEFNNILSQPTWWNKTVQVTYLGVYSDKKYTEFMRHTGIVDFGALTPTLKRYWALQFKQAIITHNLTEDEEGKVPMVVTVY